MTFVEAETLALQTLKQVMEEQIGAGNVEVRLLETWSTSQRSLVLSAAKRSSAEPQPKAELKITQKSSAESQERRPRRYRGRAENRVTNHGERVTNSHDQ